MPAQYHIFQDINLKYVTITQTTELSELRALAQTYICDPLFSNQQGQLIDLSGLVDAKSNFMDVLTLRNFYLRIYGAVPAPIPVAIFAPSDLGFGISRMFKSLMMGQNLMDIEIFEDRAAALDWLKIDRTAAKRIDAKRTSDVPAREEATDEPY